MNLDDLIAELRTLGADVQVWGGSRADLVRSWKDQGYQFLYGGQAAEKFVVVFWKGGRVPGAVAELVRNLSAVASRDTQRYMDQEFDKLFDYLDD